MRPLAIDPETFVLRFPVHVGPTGRVRFKTQQYSMPPQAIHVPATLYLGRETVRIVAGRWESTHRRLGGAPNQKSILPEHREALVAMVSGDRGRCYLKREHLLELGADAIEYLTEIRYRRPHQWKRQVQQLHELLSLHGEERVRAAITQALDEQAFGAEYVAHHLGELTRLQQMVFTEVRQ